MAQLSSPGVSVTVIDESFYTPAAPGTTPLIIVASAENKQNSAGTGTAPGTLAANAGKTYLLTSQKDLVDTFGTPVFKTDANNNPIHAGEQNEYGLQTAYSYLGVSNRAYVVRAPIDLGQLDARASAPAGDPENGQYWFDTANSNFGVFQWSSAAATTASGQAFANKIPTVITDETRLDSGNSWAPRQSVGAIGDYAVVYYNSTYTLWFKKALTDTAAGQWVAVGTPQWKASWPAAQTGRTAFSMPFAASTGYTLTISINSVEHDVEFSTGTTPNNASILDNLASAFNGLELDVTAAVVNNKLEFYSTGVDFTVISTPLSVLMDLTAGTYKAPAVQITPHFQVPTFKRSENTSTVQGYPTGSIWVKATEPNLGARWRVKVFSSLTGSWNERPAPIYQDGAAALRGLDPTGGGSNLAVGTLYVKSNVSEGTNSGFPNLANFKVYARRDAGPTQIRSSVLAGAFTTASNNTFEIRESVKGSNSKTDTITVSVAGSSGAEGFVSALTSALGSLTLNGNPYVSRITAERLTSGEVVIRHLDGGEIYLVDGVGTPLAQLFTPYNPSTQAGTVNYYVDPADVAPGVAPDSFVASLWSPFADIIPSANAPTTEAVDGQLWYNSIIDEVDIMVHNGVKWVGYREAGSQYYSADTTRVGYTPIVSATRPSTVGKLDGDLWVDTSDVENYPRIYKFSLGQQKWILVDSTDQTSEDGILFADARWADAGSKREPSSIVDLITSSFVDFDSPDPALYPRGMLLWNLRRSGFNVKKFVRNYVNVAGDNIRMPGGPSMGDYYPNRWVTVSSNQEDGAGTFGRKAQRKVVIQALQELVNSNQQLRDEESRVFNLIACPGYPELIGEMISLNYDRGLTAFVVGDTPARLTPDATSLSNWGNNLAGALEDNDDGLVSSDEYLGVFYPWGFTSDNIGNNIVVPPSHMILRTIALSDNVSYPWFAPAGTRRGGITNATAVGYIDSEGEFQSVALNNGQRDTLASIKVNPITFITGTGLVNYGQYTRARNASSLDRINVARLVIFLRRQFSQLAKPYVFEPNDKITRDELKGAAESLLLELVGQRALYDYIVVCDTSNNTPSRIDRNELYLDVAIEPVKAVEFIYIPLRLKNTGEIQGLAQ
jgi:hypothetical protein